MKSSEEKVATLEANKRALDDATILEFSQELVKHDELIAFLSDNEAAANKQVLELQENNDTLIARVATLETQLAQVPVNEGAAVKLEDVLAANTELEATLQMKEDTNMVLVQQLERECEAHQATRDDAESLQSRLAVVSEDLKVVFEENKSLESRAEVAELERRVMEEKVKAVVEELSKESEQLEQSKKSVEALLLMKVGRCDELEKENRSLRELSQSSMATLAASPSSFVGTPLSNVTNNSSTLTPPSRAMQKKTRGNSWFGAGAFSPIVSFPPSGRYSPRSLTYFSRRPPSDGLLLARHRLRRRPPPVLPGSSLSVPRTISLVPRVCSKPL